MTDRPLWDVDMLAPLVQSSLTLGNLVKDSEYIRKNPDSSMTIVSRQLLAEVNLDSLVSINTPPYEQTTKISSLVLDERTVVNSITIGQLADAMIANGEPLGTIIKTAATLGFPIDLTGATLPVVNFNNISLDISQFFQEASVATGNIRVEITNNLPIGIQTIDYAFRNRTNSAVVIADVFQNLAAGGGSDVTNKDLAGMDVEGQLLGNISTLQFMEPSGSVVLNLNQSLDVTITISNVSVNSAIAVFPDQEVGRNEEEVELIGMGDVALTYAELASGSVKVEVFSTAQDKIYFDYEIPGAIKNGQPFTTSIVAPAAEPNSHSYTVFTYDFSGYGLDLTGKDHNATNTFTNRVIASIRYSGIVVPFSLQDSVTVRISTVDFKPTYVKGYLGQNTFELGPAEAEIDIFKNVHSGSLDFEYVDMKLIVDNGFGIAGSLLINDITAINSRTGASQTLTGANVGTPLTINKAQESPADNGYTVLDIGGSSNVTSLIGILPDKINYKAEVRTNIGGNTGSYADFAYNSGTLASYLDVEMPLSFIASDMVLSDTAFINAASMEKQAVKSGKFSVFVNNGFPLSAILTMYFMDQGGTITDSVQSPQGAIQAASVDNTFRVQEKRTSQIMFEADEKRMNHLYNSRNVIFKVKFSTAPSSQHLKLYSDYAIDFKLVGDINYTVSR
jgi:hypothetical protein